MVPFLPEWVSVLGRPTSNRTAYVLTVNSFSEYLFICSQNGTIRVGGGGGISRLVESLRFAKIQRNLNWINPKERGTGTGEQNNKVRYQFSWAPQGSHLLDRPHTRPPASQLGKMFLWGVDPKANRKVKLPKAGAPVFPLIREHGHRDLEPLTGEYAGEGGGRERHKISRPVHPVHLQHLLQETSEHFSFNWLYFL